MSYPAIMMNVLSLLRERGDLGASVADIQQEIPALDCTRDAIRSLKSLRWVSAALHEGHALYTITAAGRRRLQLHEDFPDDKPGERAAPRSFATVGTYRGEKPLALRPKAMDAYDIPHLENGVRRPRVRPVSCGGYTVKEA